MATPLRPQRGPQVFRQTLVVVLVVVAIGAVFSFLNTPTEAPEEVTLSTLVEKIKADEVKEIEVKGEQTMFVTLADGSVLTTRKEATQPLTDLLTQSGVPATKISQLNITVSSNTGFIYWLSLLSPGLISILVIGVILWFMFRQLQGANSKD